MSLACLRSTLKLTANVVKISQADKRTFDAVMAHYEFDSEEIEFCKVCYRNDPEAGRITYAALATEIPKPVEVLPWVVISLPPNGLPPDRGEIRRG